MSSKSTEWSQLQRKHGFFTTCGKACDVKDKVKKTFYSLCPKHRKAQLVRMRDRKWGNKENKIN